MEIEIWKTIPNYENYQVSNLGRVKSLERLIPHSTGVGKVLLKEKILKQCSSKNKYPLLNLSVNGKVKQFYVHNLVAIAFLNHKPCGHKLVINHINFNRTDNRLKNLEIITNRENCSFKNNKHSSNYVGVHWCKISNKWISSIRYNKKQYNLGSFISEYDAHLAYQKRLKEIT